MLTRRVESWRDAAASSRRSSAGGSSSQRRDGATARPAPPPRLPLQLLRLARSARPAARRRGARLRLPRLRPLREAAADHVYTLAWQADAAEELVRRAGSPPVFLVAHDMGTSVATELMARESARRARDRDRRGDALQRQHAAPPGEADRRPETAAQPARPARLAADDRASASAPSSRGSSPPSTRSAPRRRPTSGR